MADKETCSFCGLFTIVAVRVQGFPLCKKCNNPTEHMFSVGRRIAQLQRERDEARKSAAAWKKAAKKHYTSNVKRKEFSEWVKKMCKEHGPYPDEFPRMRGDLDKFLKY